ncbi:DUF6538 domain-containing protein [Octadecabacter antarcticus]|uniref:DUF6538 domain-containing protein n=1 Tax=Octadecabacter antarcticus TaxID=1217908 RepID=UPI0026A61705
MAYDKSVPFSFTKDGIYYFERRVPSELRKYYEGSKIAYSLRTRLNRPGFTGGQNSRRIARYGTDTKEEDLEAVFT